MYRESKYLESQAVSLVERSIVHSPYLRGSPSEVLLCTYFKLPYIIATGSVNLPLDIAGSAKLQG